MYILIFKLILLNGPRRLVNFEALSIIYNFLYLPAIIGTLSADALKEIDNIMSVCVR